MYHHANHLQQEHSNAKQLHKKQSAIRPLVKLTATCSLLFFATVNLTPAVAQTISTVPVLGNAAHVLTVQTWSEKEDNGNIIVNQPKLNGVSALSQSFNTEIETMVAKHTAEAKQRQNDYHDAFIATGGTETEWKTHDLQTTIDYQIFNQSEQYLSFVVTSTDSWNAASAEYHYYNIDLQTNKLLTLQDILGDDYVATASKIIHQQMQTRMAEDKSITYDDFGSIRSDIDFYINEAGNPVIVFDKYEVAPGFMGRPEFEITK